jgi:hypothetical protein
LIARDSTITRVGLENLTNKSTVTHEELCERARRWLSGSRRCEPVFSNIASCSEIPDAIGWSSCYGWSGSTVVECKTSRSDFYADRKKYLCYVKDENGDQTSVAHMGIRHSVSRMTKAFAEQHGYRLLDLARMGDFRFFLCEPDIVTDNMVTAHAPDHGLLWMDGRRIKTVRNAVRRQATLIDKDAEIRYLRFAIINSKQPENYVMDFSDTEAIQ